MKRRHYRYLLPILAFFLAYHDASAQEDELHLVLKEELTREFEILSKADPAVYYMDYRVDNKKSFALEANFGNIINQNSNQLRLCQPTIRIGNYKLDNTREVNVNSYGYGQYSLAQYIPINDSPTAIKQTLWRLTDQAYKTAKQKYKNVENADLDEELKIDDFSVENASSFYDPVEELTMDTIYWQNVVREASKVFQNNDDIISGKVFLSYNHVRKTLVTTEGTSITQNSGLAQLHIVGEIVNEKNEVVSLYESFNGPSLDKLPSADSIVSKSKEVLVLLRELKEAPFAEPYTGPAILHPRVAAVFFHEIFGHRIEGHRLKSDSDGQTFKEKVGSKILPDFLDIYSDPTLTDFNNTDLNGVYKYDDQGVKSKKITVVEDGYLKQFLMSRSPIENFASSNGHGRSEIGASPVARQSNLIINSDAGYSDSKLRLMMIEECKKQDKPYGYYFRDVTGGFTQTSRYATNAFNIMPTLVYRVYVDGRPDELVKGVDLIGTPLAMFAEVLASGTSVDVFNGICGAESGNIPVSAVAPSLLVRRIETQKKPVNERKSAAPILPSPDSLEQ